MLEPGEIDALIARDRLDPAPPFPTADTPTVAACTRLYHRYVEPAAGVRIPDAAFCDLPRWVFLEFLIQHCGVVLTGFERSRTDPPGAAYHLPQRPGMGRAAPARVFRGHSPPAAGGPRSRPPETTRPGSPSHGAGQFLRTPRGGSVAASTLGWIPRACPRTVAARDGVCLLARRPPLRLRCD
jgi:hypothetical protein